MIVVAIIGVLATIAGTTYSRYSHKARAAEVYGVMGEFRAKEEAYRAEYSVYCNSGTSGCASINPETAFYPALLTTGEPKAKTVMPLTARPAGWTSLGIAPGKDALYCGYDAIAATQSTFTQVGPYGQALFANANPTGPFWYIVATCDLDGRSGTNSYWVTGQNTQVVVQYNEGY